MAVAEILEHLGDGKYRVQVVCHRQWVGPLMEATQKRIDFYEEAMDELMAQIIEAEAETTAAVNALEQVLWELAGQTMSDEQKRAVLDAQTQIQLRRNAENAARAQHAIADLRLMANQARLAELQEVKDRVDNDIRDLWCADLTENLAGNKATLEINGEPEHMVLAPLSLEPLPDIPERLPHGQLKPMRTMTTAQSVFNWTIMPGWQKWKPTYRTGVIGSIADGMASVTLDDAHSYIKNFEINQAASLDAVPIDYMDCHAGAFEEGDHVVVMFADQDFGHPRVIGFVEEPRGCGFIAALVTTHGRASDVGNLYQEDMRDAAILLMTPGLDDIKKIYKHSSLVPSKTTFDITLTVLKNYYITAHSVAYINDRAFFLIEDTGSCFEHDHPYAGNRVGMAQTLLCGTDPEWTVSLETHFPTGDVDSMGRPIYGASYNNYLYVSAGPEYLFVVGVYYSSAGSGSYSGEILKYTHDGEYVSAHPLPSAVGSSSILTAFLNNWAGMEYIGDGLFLIFCNKSEDSSPPWLYVYDSETGALIQRNIHAWPVEWYSTRVARYFSATPEFFYQAQGDADVGDITIGQLDHDGALVAEFTPPTSISSEGYRNMTASQQRIYVSTTEGAVHVFRTESGTPVMESQIIVPIIGLAVGQMSGPFADIRDVFFSPRKEFVLD